MSPYIGVERDSLCLLSLFSPSLKTRDVVKYWASRPLFQAIEWLGGHDPLILAFHRYGDF